MNASSPSRSAEVYREPRDTTSPHPSNQNSPALKTSIVHRVPIKWCATSINQNSPYISDRKIGTGSNQGFKTSLTRLSPCAVIGGQLPATRPQLQSASRRTLKLQGNNDRICPNIFAAKLAAAGPKLGETVGTYPRRTRQPSFFAVSSRAYLDGVDRMIGTSPISDVLGRAIRMIGLNLLCFLDFRAGSPVTAIARMSRT